MVLSRDLTRVIAVLFWRSQDWHVLARAWTRTSHVESEHSRKEPSRQLIRWLFGTPTHDEAGTTTTTSTWLPQCRCIAHGLRSVEGMPEGDSKSASLNRTYCYPNSTDGHVWQSRRGHHYRETWPGSSLYCSRGPRTDMSRPGLEPGPPEWVASTLEKSHLDSLYAGCSEPLLMMRLALQQQPLQYYISRDGCYWLRNGKRELMRELYLSFSITQDNFSLPCLT